MASRLKLCKFLPILLREGISMVNPISGVNVPSALDNQPTAPPVVPPASGSGAVDDKVTIGNAAHSGVQLPVGPSGQAENGGRGSGSSSRSPVLAAYDRDHDGDNR